MGPRSDERGNLGWDERGARDSAASMGPRSDERGNPELAAKYSMAAASFNGAALR